MDICRRACRDKAYIFLAKAQTISTSVDRTTSAVATAAIANRARRTARRPSHSSLQAGAPLDNNLVERALKRAVLHRKNALFYRTLNGAQVGDLFMALIHNCQLCSANSFDYLIQLQRMPGNWPPARRNGCPGTTATPWRELPRYDEGDLAEKDRLRAGPERQSRVGRETAFPRVRSQSRFWPCINRPW